ncbi:hypothetical protein Agabi119p4_4122 [Agaricus bisporus var. burnettii]|uniref:UBZ4-type domain-containing protein n=1 Tax=Agaricus bisporus var. burnettii TaxID=192524 RepID=A0A8H7F2N7_AGABI|nr:hypothetical protein Agabi119p4_4122 [Agaricus bisporus var. burnettii]
MRALPLNAKLQEKKRNHPDTISDQKLFVTISKDKGKEEEDLPPRVKKPKRAETRQCPACDELIPLRLMARHAQLEAERVEEIIKQIGSSEPILLTDEFDDLSRPGPSTGSRSRRSAIKALKAFTTSSPFSATNEQVIKTIQTIQKHRKQRHARFKEMAREDDEGYLRSSWARRNRTMNDEVICPICSRGVRGDQDVVDAHIDSCLADEARRSEEERVRRAAQEGQEDWMNTVDVVLLNGAVGHVGNIQGMGFHSRDPADQDVEDDIDIDGDDQDTYGEAQFTEGDILPVDEAHPAPVDEDVDVEIEGDQTDEADAAQQSLRDLIAVSKVIVRQTTLGEGSGSNSPVTLVGRVPVSGDVESTGRESAKPGVYPCIILCLSAVSDMFGTVY